MIKRIIIFFLVIFMVMFLFGCSFFNTSDKPIGNINIDNVGSIMEKYLNDKYSNTFIVSDISVNKGSGPFNDNPGYKGVAVRIDDDNTFDVQYSSKDGKIKDNYGKILYGENIKKDFTECIGMYSSIYIDAIGVYVPLTDECWSKDEEYVDYLKNSGVYAWAWIRVNEENDISKDMFELCEKLNNKNIFFSFTVTYNERTFVISHELGEEMPTENEINGYFS